MYFLSSLVRWCPATRAGEEHPFTYLSWKLRKPVAARHTSCTQLLWKPRGPSREGKHVYLTTFATSRPVGSRNTSCKQLLWKPRDPSKEGAPIYLVTFETSRPTGQGTVPVSSYCGNPQSGQARHTHLLSYL
jgi:hypothetical protein